jgi:hypothetical protein
VCSLFFCLLYVLYVVECVDSVCGLIVVMYFFVLFVVLLLYHCHRVKTHLQLIILIIIK